MSWKYEDIVNLERPSMGLRPRMSLEARAMQFGAFEALSGHSEAIDNTAAANSEDFEEVPFELENIA